MTSHNPENNEGGFTPSSEASHRMCGYMVLDGGLLEEKYYAPNELYFCEPPGGPKPSEDETKAKMMFEAVCSTMRTVIKDKFPEVFEEYFKKILLTAQGVFNPAGFSPHGLADLDRYKSEMAQLVGGKIKSKYLTGMLRSCAFANILIFIACAMLYSVLYFLEAKNLIYVESVGTEVDSAAVKNTDLLKKSKGKEWRSIPYFLRWETGYSVGHMSLLLAASMWGLLVAFWARNFDPSFENLTQLKDDQYHPLLRLAFFGIIIFFISSILIKKFIVVSFGETFSSADINNDALTAGLVGAFLGLSERILPKEAEAWALNFIEKIQIQRKGS